MKCGTCKFSMINSNNLNVRNGKVNNYSLEIIYESCMFCRDAARQVGEIKIINIL